MAARIYQEVPEDALGCIVRERADIWPLTGGRLSRLRTDLWLLRVYAAVNWSDIRIEAVAFLDGVMIVARPASSPPLE